MATKVLPEAEADDSGIVVTVGTSAACSWGAVAGVFNFQIEDFQGGKSSVQNGVTCDGDARSRFAALAADNPFAGGRASR